MQLKTYSGPDMASALASVKAELGPDAIIVATREVRKASLLREGLVEVTAALDASEIAAPVVAKAAANKYAKADSADPLRDELRAMLKPGARAAAEPATKAVDLDTLLETAEIDEDLASELTDGVNDVDGLTRALSLELARYTYPGITKRAVIALVGPTGVGKTTSIAKIAAVCALVRNRKVALISCDTYRIGANEQLATYAELIGVQCSVATDRKSYEQALAKHRDCDLVLVDTAGRGVRDAEHIKRLADMFRGTETQMWLTLAATTRTRELKGLIRAYETLPLKALVMTKLDEAAQLGTVVNAAYRARLPLAYVTNGQRVPEDIARPSPALLAEAIVQAAIHADDELGSWSLDIGSEVASWS